MDKRLVVGFNSCLDLIRKLAPEETVDLREPGSPGSPDGGQREVKVSEEVMGELIDSLGYSSRGPGGVVGQAALTAPPLGVNVYAHVVEKCRELTDFFSDSVFLAGREKFEPASGFQNPCTPPRHFVVESGTTRIIATCDQAAFNFNLDRDFMEQVRKISVNKALLSGFHLVRARYSGKISNLSRELEEWKETNPHLFIHLELGYFQSPRTYQATEELFPHVDSVGLSEEELKSLTGKDLKPGLEEMAARVRRLLLHSPRFSALVTDRDDPREARDALQFATLVTSYRVAKGEPPSFQDLEQFTTPRPDEGGVRMARKLDGRELKGKEAVVVPSLKVEVPERVVGAGDTLATAYTLAI